MSRFKQTQLFGGKSTSEKAPVRVQKPVERIQFLQPTKPMPLGKAFVIYGPILFTLTYVAVTSFHLAIRWIFGLLP